MRISDIEFYEDIDELPIWRKQEASNYALMANFCAPTIESINDRMAQMDGHLGRAYKFIEAKDNDNALEAIQELFKARINLSHAFNENFSKTDYNTLIAACYLKAIKGNDYKIKGKSDIEKASKELSQFSSKELSQKIEDVKKKLKLN